MRTATAERTCDPRCGSRYRARQDGQRDEASPRKERAAVRQLGGPRVGSSCSRWSRSEHRLRDRRRRNTTRLDPVRRLRAARRRRDGRGTRSSIPPRRCRGLSWPQGSGRSCSTTSPTTSSRGLGRGVLPRRLCLPCRRRRRRRPPARPASRRGAVVDALMISIAIFSSSGRRSLSRATRSADSPSWATSTRSLPAARPCPPAVPAALRVPRAGFDVAVRVAVVAAHADARERLWYSAASVDERGSAHARVRRHALRLRARRGSALHPTMAELFEPIRPP